MEADIFKLNKMYKKKIFLLFIKCYFIIGALSAQTVSGIIYSKKDNSPVAFATVRIIDNLNNLKNYSITSETGFFIINSKAAPGDSVNITAVGFKPYKFSLDANDKSSEIKIYLDPSSQSILKEVVVARDKPIIESKIGKLIFNVENSPQIQTSSVIELLGRAPGVWVDPMSQNISLNGKQNVLMLIDNRRIYLSGQQAFQYLNNISASSIQKVELINTPSAKYNAEAVINILTKRDKKLGWNGSFSTSSGYRKVPDLSGSSIVNYRSKKLAVTASFGVNYDKGPSKGINIQENNSFSRRQDYYSLLKSSGGYGKIGIDYYADSINTFGFTYTYNLSNSNKKFHSVTELQDFGNSTLQLEDNNILKSDFNRNLLSFNYTRQYNQKKRIMLNADYSFRNVNGDNTFSTVKNQAPFRNRLNDLTTNSSLLTTEIDFTNMWKEKYEIEMGTRVTNVKTKNINIFNNENGVESNLPLKEDDRFNYLENVFAGYINVTAQFNKKSGMQLGMRGEYTRTSGESISLNEKNVSDYVTLLPNIAFNFVPNPNHNFTLAYNKAINRPNFKNLNPFRYYNDIYSATEGNPMLKPSVSHNISFQYFAKQKYVFSAFYGIYLDQNEIFLRQDTLNDVLVSRMENYGKSNALGLQAQIPFKLFKWWTNAVKFQTGYLTTKKEGFSREGTFIFSNLTSTFVLPKQYNIELNSTFNYTPVQGIYKLDPSYYFNLSASKAFLNNKLAAKIHALDFLSTFRYRSRTTQNGQYYDTRNRGRGAMFMLSANYRFGKTSVKGANAKSKSLGEEANR
ncbi:TonB-dependent receptor family protein [Sphingobacterium sp.]|uniref:TonB-dependent receptor family protein n=1 Tax=Sphingobacterium sp. TaxID=341027 RepID=UPI0031D12869